MIKYLFKRGLQWAIVLDRRLLRACEIDETTPLSITREGERIVISHVHDASRDRRFRESVEKFYKQYGEVLRRLADS
jgi:hypothetical protein